MGVIVDYTFYTDVYKGSEADAASFPALCARAADVIGAATRWADENNVVSRLPARFQTLYKKAICAQIDFFVLNGVETINETGSSGFTVGKVTIHGKQNSGNGGRMAEAISPASISYLEQTGLLSRQVPTFDGWWF